MKNIFKIVSITFILLTACNSAEKNIFFISEPNEQENDFLFMVESTNVREIQPDSTEFFLTKEERSATEKLIFKNFGKIHTNQNFDVYILLKEGSHKGRDYTFIVRTYNSHFEILDSYELALWIDAKNQRCYGSISENLIIKRRCENERFQEVRKIINDGSIVSSSVNGK